MLSCVKRMSVQAVCKYPKHLQHKFAHAVFSFFIFKKESNIGNSVRCGNILLCWTFQTVIKDFVWKTSNKWYLLYLRLMYNWRFEGHQAVITSGTHLSKFWQLLIVISQLSRLKQEPFQPLAHDHWKPDLRGWRLSLCRVTRGHKLAAILAAYVDHVLTVDIVFAVRLSSKRVQYRLWRSTKDSAVVQLATPRSLAE